MSRFCEGQRVPHAHKDDALEYQYLDKEGANDLKSVICSRCVAYDRSRGYTMERTFSEEEGPRFVSIDNGFRFYETEPDRDDFNDSEEINE